MKLADIEIARVGLGTNRLTNTDRDRAFLRAAVQAGVNHIDTAHLYTDGESERTIGAALAPFPDELLVVTKGGYNGARPQTLTSELGESLERLATETIGLYYLHRVDAAVPIETSLETLREHQSQGRIRHIGISAVTVEQIERARQVVPVAAVQNHYSLSERGSEDVVDYCTENGITFVPYFPLRGEMPAAVAQIAAAHGATPSQIALAWLLRRSPIMAPIPGTLSLEHLKENLGALELELTEEEYQALA